MVEESSINAENERLGLVLVPGITSGTELFDMIEPSLSFTSVRVETWDSAEDLEEITLSELHELIDERIRLLEEVGCKSIGVVGKSFGGQLALTSKPEANFLVLWAPAVGFGEDNVEKWRSTKLKHAQTATDISVDKSFLEKIDSEVKIIHGTEDQIVDIENSRKICEALPKCEFSEIEGTNHSFTENRDLVIEETVSFLDQQVS